MTLSRPAGAAVAQSSLYRGQGDGHQPIPTRLGRVSQTGSYLPVHISASPSATSNKYDRDRAVVEIKFADTLHNVLAVIALNDVSRHRRAELQGYQDVVRVIKGVNEALDFDFVVVMVRG